MDSQATVDQIPGIGKGIVQLYYKATHKPRIEVRNRACEPATIIISGEQISNWTKFNSSVSQSGAAVGVEREHVKGPKLIDSVRPRKTLKHYLDTTTSCAYVSVLRRLGDNDYGVYGENIRVPAFYAFNIRADRFADAPIRRVQLV